MLVSAGIDVLLTVPRSGTKAGGVVRHHGGGEFAPVGERFDLCRLDTGGGPRDVVEGGGYVLFTSGSTGWPKGVLLSHANVLHFVTWAAEEFQVGPDDRIGAQSALTFDLSTFDIFSSALAGSCTHLLPDTLRAFPKDTVAWLAQNRITVFYAIPTLFHMLLQRGEIDRNVPPDLRLAVFGGEAFAPALLERYLATFDSTFYNLYGPTETNACTYERIPATWRADDGLSIGRPLPGLDLMLAGAGPGDSHGEIVVGGPSLMRGYLIDGALHDPTELVTFPDGRRVRAYASGDLARRGGDGRLFLGGRRDRQVKRNGLRIELLDIESTLQELADVELCAVVQRRDPGEIWAYVSGTGVETARVSRELANLLPRRMLPERIVRLDQLPLTPHGKVDRRSLEEAPVEELT
jgi:acyl-coenzyme A synthetase/AMP-(fatty) acid ligase